ncbi:MAG: DNA-3-methyladenine glycosylase 2 family protein [Clostridia bacterium]|nr:DNA-3-methyladenine glycosylase 2 family protein [Clostridia bacterium]MBQ5838101.1 DNA-3-methyladenine glycosylase 2 family protein [Clostridia bacterium]
MKFTKIENHLLLSECKNFDPFVSAECGQCFRFNAINKDEYVIFAQNRRLTIRKQDNGWLFLDITEEEFREKFVYYFDLERDYGAIIKSFSSDESISRAAESGNGIRIFRQDAFETLVSFIISANNNIPRIKKIIEALCELLGERVGDSYSFPTPESIVNAGIEGLAPIRAGFRTKYIVDAAQKVHSGEISLEYIQTCGYTEALNELKKIKGVGDKVANCVLLFGFGYYNAFPIDVWVKRVIGKYYGEGFDPTVLGEYAGVAQQYLFYYERNILGREEEK